MNFLVSIQLVEVFSPKNAINAKKIIRSGKWVFLNLKNLTHPFNSYIVKSKASVSDGLSYQQPMGWPMRPSPD